MKQARNSQEKSSWFFYQLGIESHQILAFQKPLEASGCKGFISPKQYWTGKCREGPGLSRCLSKYIEIKSLAWVFVLVTTKESPLGPSSFNQPKLVINYPAALCFSYSNLSYCLDNCLISRKSPVPTACLEPKIGAAFLGTSVPIISWSPNFHLELKLVTHQFSPTTCRCICFRHTALGPFGFLLFLFLKHCRSHISPRGLPGTTSAPSSSAIVCKEQCEGRWRREKWENAEGIESRAESYSSQWLLSSTVAQRAFSLQQWKVEQPKEWCAWYKNQLENNKTVLRMALFYSLYLQSMNNFQVLARSQAEEWIW